jgi:LysR family transcriptional regulator, hydrogen peroxide-inducible genes activator
VIEACPKCVDADADGPKPQTGSSLETIRYMVIGGLGITVLPRSSAENREASGEPLLAKPFAAPAPQRRIAMVWRKTFPRMKAIEKLREAIIGSGIKGVTLLRDAKPQEE